MRILALLVAGGLLCCPRHQGQEPRRPGEIGIATAQSDSKFVSAPSPRSVEIAAGLKPDSGRPVWLGASEGCFSPDCSRVFAAVVRPAGRPVFHRGPSLVGTVELRI